MVSVNVPSNSRYGPLQVGLSLEIGEGYHVLVGNNNAGKSALLQLAFVNAVDSTGPGSAALLLSDRDLVMGSTETAGQNLEDYNNQLAAGIRGYPRRFETANAAAATSQLARLLLTHSDFRGQLQLLDDYLIRLGLPRSVTKAGQVVHFENVPLPQQGSGLRSVFTIISALTDDSMRVICIDEPEISLEATTQRLLRDLLIELAGERTILVATHSHLFLNRSTPENNHVVQRDGAVVAVDTVKDEAALYDVAFRLLGNSTTDLWFPSNYWVVEGASDQIIAERILELVDRERARDVKVVAAGGVERVANSVVALEDALRPLVSRTSPYSGRVVALVDGSVGKSADRFTGMGDRFYVLSATSLEAYLPGDLYERASRNKEDDLTESAKLKGNYVELAAFKRQLSEQIAAVIAPEDLENLPEFNAAARKALAL
jgi:ABC-type cobalamin transport system ATPase subunit